MSLFMSLILILFFSLTHPVYAINEKSQEIQVELEYAKENLLMLQEYNMSTTRYNDSLFIIQQLLNTQIQNEEKGIATRYDFVDLELNKIHNLYNDELLAYDEFQILKETLVEFESTNQYIIDNLVKEVETGLAEERYEDILSDIDAIYEEISRQEALQSKVAAIYTATTRSITIFFAKYGKRFFISIGIVLLALLIFHRPLIRSVIRGKMVHLEKKRIAITRLMKSAQRQYFDKGVMDETTYRIHTAKYSQFIIEINRKFPLLNEELSIYKKILPDIHFLPKKKKTEVQTNETKN